MTCRAEEREQTRDIFVRLTRLDDDEAGDDDTGAPGATPAGGWRWSS